MKDPFGMIHNQPHDMAEEAPQKMGRGRPPGSENKATLIREMYSTIPPPQMYRPGALVKIQRTAFIVSLLLFATAIRHTVISGESQESHQELYSPQVTIEVIARRKSQESLTPQHFRAELTKCSSIIPQNWCLDTEGNPRYVGEDGQRANISHYTHNGFDRCLANKSVVFIGDSRVRYQFMALAHFLRSGKHLRCGDFQVNGFEPSNDSECYLINESLETLNWNHWYETSTASLGSNSTPDGHEQSSLCDCYRDSTFTTSTTMENRYIRRRSPFGQLDLVYLQNFENLIRLTKDFPPSS